MPSGNTHDKINLLFLPVFLAVMVSIGFASVRFSISFAIGFLFGTFLLGPDLDLKSKLYYRWGMFKFIWIPYHKMFSHRSIFTHGFIIGDVIRIGYLTVWFFALFSLPKHFMGEIDLKQKTSQFIVEEQFIVYGFIVFLILLFINKLSKGYILNKIKKFCIKNSATILTLMMVAAGVIVINHFDANQYDFAFFSIGIILSSTVHIASDIIVSAFKKLFR